MAPPPPEAEPSDLPKALAEYRLLAEISRVITSTPDIGDVYAQFAGLVRQTVAFDRLAIVAIDPERETVTTLYAVGIDVPGIPRIGPLGNSTAAEVAKTHASLIVQANRPTSVPFTHAARQAGIRSRLFVPLLLRNELIGILVFSSVTQNAYNQRDIERAERVAGQIAGVIQNANQQVVLRTRQEQLDFTLDAARIGLWEWDYPDGKIRWSRSLYALYGVDPGSFEPTPESFMALVHPDDREPLRQVIRRAVRGEAPYLSQIRVIWPDRSEHMLEARGRLIRDASGTVSQITGVVVDLTEWRRFETLIRELSTPILLIEDHVLLVPLIGTFDARRAEQFQGQVLRAISDHRARAIVIDVTGVPLIDTYVGSVLQRVTQAATLLGARAILTGISAAVAQSLVSLGVRLDTMTVAGELRDGLLEARRLAGRS